MTTPKDNFRSQLRWLVRRQHGRCYWCGAQFSHVRPATRDHLLPIKAGGTNAGPNIVASCPECGRLRSNPKLGRSNGYGLRIPEIFLTDYALVEAFARGFPCRPRPGVIVTVWACGSPVPQAGPCLREPRHPGRCSPSAARAERRLTGVASSSGRTPGGVP